MDKEILAQFAYSPITGVLTRFGKPISALNEAGYVRLVVSNKFIYAHRLIWKLVTGEWPKRVDHINKVKHDNRWVNLREATGSENAFNRRKGVNNTTGITGICWVSTGRWRVQLGKTYFGLHKDFFEACCTRKSAENKSGIKF
jgi:hypothetical protein